MHLISKQKMSEKLAESWAFLSGVSLTFSETKAQFPQYNKHNLTVVLPVIFQKESESSAMAIGLIIDAAEAKRVASFMFGESAEALTESDLKDACKESCNILGGGLILDSDNKLGIPQEISTENFLELQSCSDFNVTFVSDTPYDGLIILTILDVKDNNIWSRI